jgi:hypothetical protein
LYGYEVSEGFEKMYCGEGGRRVAVARGVRRVESERRIVKIFICENRKLADSYSNTRECLEQEEE